MPYSFTHTYSISCSWFIQLFRHIQSNGWMTHWTGRDLKCSCRNLILRNILKFACWQSGRPRKTPVRLVGFKPGPSCVRSRNADCEFPLQHFAHYAVPLPFSKLLFVGYIYIRETTGSDKRYWSDKMMNICINIRGRLPRLSPPCRGGLGGGGGGACGPQWPYGLCRRELSVPGRASQAGQAVRERPD